MALSLYRRHRLECEAGRPEDSRTAEYQERQRGFKGRCRCQIHASGTVGGRFSRRSTNTLDWDKARAWAAVREAADDWNGSTPAALPVASENPLRLTVADAMKVYLASRKGANPTYATYRKYVTFTRKLQAFADARGFVMLDQFTTSDVDLFYGTSTLGPRAKGKMLGMLRAFWRFVANRAWVAKSPVSSDLKQPIGANRIVNKAPFTDEQLADIVSACDRFNDFSPARWGNRHGAGVWTGAVRARTLLPVTPRVVRRPLRISGPASNS